MNLWNNFLFDFLSQEFSLKNVHILKQKTEEEINRKKATMRYLSEESSNEKS